MTIPDFTPRFTAEGRKLIFRTELGAHVGDRYVVTRIEMGVRLPADAEGHDAAYAELNRQVTLLHLHLALGGDAPHHLTDQRHRGRAPRKPNIPPELEAALRTPIEAQA